MSEAELALMERGTHETETVTVEQGEAREQQVRKAGYQGLLSTNIDLATPGVRRASGAQNIRPGFNNEFDVPQAPAVPTPRDVEDNPLAWQADSLCAQTDPEAFFPEKGGSTRDAKKVCASCDVRDDCLQYALDNDERFGIWGGLSERERRKLKKRVA